MNQVEQAAVIINPHQTYEYNLYLSGPINNSEQYLEFYSALKSATPEDSVRIHINSEGGCLSTALEIVMHMMECQAPIQAVVGVSCSSAATLIALNCDSIMVNDYSSMLVHNMSYGSYSESASQLDLASFNSKLNEKLIRNTYTNFLTEKNLDKVLNGRDVLLDSEEIVEGWTRKRESEDVEEEGEGEQSAFDFSSLKSTPKIKIKSDLELFWEEAPPEATHFGKQSTGILGTYYKQDENSGKWWYITKTHYQANKPEFKWFESEFAPTFYHEQVVSRTE